MSDYHKNQGAIESSIRLGILLESDDPSLEPIVSSIQEAQIRWVAAWLASEGFGHQGVI